MSILSIDIETFSSYDIKTVGVYKYVEAPDFEILLFGFAYDDDPVQVIDIADFEAIPKELMKDIQHPGLIKTAYNANFERTCIAKHFGIPMGPEMWRCSSVHALTLGLPGYLEGVAQVLGLKAQKDTAGKNLIKYFSVPCKPTKSNGMRTRNYPHHDPVKWQQYKDYNAQDVVVERELRKKLERYPVPVHEWKLWQLDQQINDAGVRLDPVLVSQALACDELYTARLEKEAKELTGLENPNSVAQLKGWLGEQGLEVDKLNKDTVPGLLEEAEDEDTRRALELRQEMAKTSVDKYNAMDRSICQDERARGLLQFCGANRTWRWAGRLIQVQNLPQNKILDLALARQILREGNFELLEMLFGAPPFVLSQLIRTAFIPSPGCRFIVSDFSAIEARVIAWLADEKWVLDVFRGHGKIYEATAAQMFKVPFESIVKGHANYGLRQKGKVATLALGYQGGEVALQTMRKTYKIPESELPDAELPDIKARWRESNPKIVKLWYAAERAAITAVQERRTVRLAHGVQYRYDKGFLFADLPSGRSLAYVRPEIIPDPRFDKDGLTYEGTDQIKKTWCRQKTYGGKLVENLVQAIARDCLAVSMMRLAEVGYQIRLHVHDEVILDVPTEQDEALEHVEHVMSQPIDWASGLPLKAAAFETEFYMKD